MSNVEQQRKQREADAFRREEEHRAERRKVEERERERQRKDQERQRLITMAMNKQQDKKKDEIKACELKQDAMMKELESKQAGVKPPIQEQ